MTPPDTPAEMPNQSPSPSFANAATAMRTLLPVTIMQAAALGALLAATLIEAE